MQALDPAAAGEQELLNDEAMMRVTLALGSFSTRYTQQLNLMAAAAVLVALPVLILYMFFQRQFIQGVMSGALRAEPPAGRRTA